MAFPESGNTERKSSVLPKGLGGSGKKGRRHRKKKKEKTVKSRKIEERGVSEILGATLLMVLTVSAGAALLQIYRSQTGKGLAGISSSLRLAEHRANQLLSLIYFYENKTSGKVYAYLYGCGVEPVRLERFWLGKTEVRPLEASYLDGTPLEENWTVPRGKVVRFVFRGSSGGQFTAMSSIRTVYSWVVG